MAQYTCVDKGCTRFIWRHVYLTRLCIFYGGGLNDTSAHFQNVGTVEDNPALIDLH